MDPRVNAQGSDGAACPPHLVVVSLDLVEGTAPFGGFDAVAGALVLDLRESEFQEPEDLVEAFRHDLHDHVDGHILVLPAVVIRNGGQTAVAHAEFSGQLALRHPGHDDDVPELPEPAALDPVGQSGTF